ncbi:MAG: asparaginase [Calditrichaceae bacterium]
MKRILLVHTGGTFGMVPAEPKSILAPGNFQSQILINVPEIVNIADIDVEIPFNLDSSNIGIKEWQILTELINARMDDYDGFVIIHGTDTMVYTAAALSFTLRNLNKPVILTGAQRPLSKLRSDARTNLIDAVELATMDIFEVLIVFGQKIVRGTRAKKVSISSYDAFESPNFPLIGEIGLNIKLNKLLLYKSAAKYSFLPGFNQKALIVSIVPSLKPEYYFPMLENDIEAYIFTGFGAGNLPNTEPNWIPFIQNAEKLGKSVFICSNSMHGSVDLSLYESGQKALEAGAVGLADMTIESAYIKLLKILNITDIPGEIVSLMNENWAGEI